MSDADDADDRVARFLTASDRQAGTEVTVQETNTLDFLDAYVGGDGVIRSAFNGAKLNAENHEVVEYDE
ncbi:hypothetical protein Z052_01790 [Halorubrum sp. C191]|uniref:hypothetical protein n=1 Tax=Halorubrum sp. C191 TaxID=1383842 RepID=UPI000C07E466|nr:hypothetical protein [Halorubrum sp. C191]PHQ43894.1 hypothetical protein Z052_01790 [Halorubrum sp. C191]